MARTRCIGLVIIIGIAVNCVPACSRKKLSDREERREQMRNNAQLKRQELANAEGAYRGLLRSGNYEQDTTLFLEIKEIPDPTEGEVDPVMIPVLSGSMRLTFGSTDGGEYYIFAIDKADYDAARHNLTVVCRNEELKEVTLNLAHSGDDLEGEWNAGGLSLSGSLRLKKAEPLNMQATNIEIRGDYGGYFLWEKEGLLQHTTLSVSSSQEQTDHPTLAANVRIFVGTRDGNESLIYNFSTVEFNPLNTIMTMKAPDTEIQLTGTYEKGDLEGTWYSQTKGRMGRVKLTQGLAKAPADVTQISATAGDYWGTFTNENPTTELPSRVKLSLATFFDDERPGKLGVSGSLRFYFGADHSMEYFELPFKHADYGFFARKINAKTTGEAELNVALELDQQGISGKLSSDAFGYLGHFRVAKAIRKTDRPTHSGFAMTTMAGD